MSIMKPTAVYLMCMTVFAATMRCVCASWSASDLPNPRGLNRRICQAEEPSVLCDPDKLISKKYRTRIDKLANYLARFDNAPPQLPCSSYGFRIAVLIVKRIATSSPDARPSRADMRAFASTLHEKWRVGDPRCHNGVVLAVAVAQRRVHMSAGKRAQSKISESDLQLVLRKMELHMDEHMYDDGIMQAVHDIAKLLQGQHLPNANLDEAFNPAVWVLFAAMCIVFFVRTKRRTGTNYEQCKKLLKRLDNEVAASKCNVYEVLSCPICLENFASSQPDKQQSEKAPVTDKSAEDKSNSSSHDAFAGRQQANVTQRKKAGASDASDTNLDDADDLTERTLPCGHKFHEACVMRWLTISEQSNLACPVCRRLMSQGLDSDRSMSLSLTSLAFDDASLHSTPSHGIHGGVSTDSW